jgi:hypothetical protein
MADDKIDGGQEELVMVANVSRRPVLAQAPGGAVRLGPGERRKLPKSLIATQEIVRLRNQQVLVVTPIEAPPAAVTAAAQPQVEQAAAQEPQVAEEKGPEAAPAKPQPAGPAQRPKRSSS